MRWLVILAFALCGISASSSAQDGAVSIKNGFLTGNDFRLSTPSRQEGYAMGLIDGILLAPLFKGEKRTMAWLEGCIEGMTSDQVTAILRQYVEARPAEWNDGMHAFAYRAMRAACAAKGFRPEAVGSQ
jgi:hypothetical protein